MHNKINDFIQSVIPSGKYLSYGRGNSNVLITAPHGGNIKPITIPSRTYGNRSKDSYTRRLSELIIDNLGNSSPYYVIADIHRSRIDLNRDIDEACQNNSKSEKIWHSWNSLINSSIKEIVDIYGTCFLIDIHSYEAMEYFQFGYGISAKNYLHLFRTKQLLENTTIDSIGKSNVYNAMFGNRSLHYSVENFGFKSYIPSSERGHYSGGRTIREFSSKSVVAIQIESPISLLRENLTEVSRVLSYGINEFNRKFVLRNG